MASYATNSEANMYFTSRYPNDEWEAATDAEKTATIATATRLIDQLNFAGTKTVSTQENEFPRNTSTAIPNNIKYACYEIAYALLAGHDVEYDAETLNVRMAKFGNVTTMKDQDAIPIWMAHNIPSLQAWNYLTPYLLNTQTLKLERKS